MAVDFGRRLEVLEQQDDALIGRIIRAFGVLEYSLGKLAVRLARATDGDKLNCSESKDSEKLASLMSGSIGDHSANWTKHKEELAKVSGKTSNQIDEMAARLFDLGKVRNLICHGIWQTLGKDKLYVALWSRGVIKRLRRNWHMRRIESDSETFSRDDLVALFGEVIVLNEWILQMVDLFDACQARE